MDIEGEDKTSLPPLTGVQAVTPDQVAFWALAGQARAAAIRLLEHRDPTLPIPQDPASLMALVDRMAKTPRKYGCYLTAKDKRCIEIYHALVREQHMRDFATRLEASLKEYFHTADVRYMPDHTGITVTVEDDQRRSYTTHLPYTAFFMDGFQTQVNKIVKDAGHLAKPY